MAEIAFTAFTSMKETEQVAGRPLVRRIPDLNPAGTGQATLFDLWRFHAFFTRLRISSRIGADSIP